MAIELPEPAIEALGEFVGKRIAEINGAVFERLDRAGLFVPDPDAHLDAVGLRLDQSADELGPGDVRGAITAAAAQTRAFDTAAVATEVVNFADDWNKEQVQESWRAAGAEISVTPPLPDDALGDFRQTLEKRIDGELEAHVGAVEDLVVDARKRGVRAEELGEEFVAQSDLDQRKAELMARDHLGSLNAFASQHRNQKLGVRKYRWLTSNDERVRDTHSALGGSVVRWDQPPIVGHPGEDWNCRCTADPLIQ